MATRGRGLAWRADAVEGARAAVKFPSRQPGRRSRPPVRRFEAIVSAASEPDAIPRREPLHTLTGGPVSGVTSAGRAAHEVRPRFRIVLSFVEEGLCRRTIRQSNLPPRPWIPLPSSSWQVMGERRLARLSTARQQTRTLDWPLTRSSRSSSATRLTRRPSGVFSLGGGGTKPPRSTVGASRTQHTSRGELLCSSRGQLTTAAACARHCAISMATGPSRHRSALPRRSRGSSSPAATRIMPAGESSVRSSWTQPPTRRGRNARAGQ